MASCSRSASHHTRLLDEAEELTQTNVDSAITLLDAIDAADLKDDSIRARYHYLRAWGHLRQNRSLIGDSLIEFAHNYYKGKDVARDMRSGIAFAWYKFWVGDMQGAITLLDSLSGLENVPDTLLTQALRIRVVLGTAEYQGKELIPFARKLALIETDTLRRLDAKYKLISAYEYAGQLDAALALTDSLIDFARTNRLGNQQFVFEIERAQVLGEMGLPAESNAVIDGIFEKSAPDNGAADYLHLYYAMNSLNMGNLNRASRELATADSFATKLRDEDDTYYRSFSNLLHTMIEFKQTGKMRLIHVTGLNNRQRERFNRMEASQWESERGALEQQARALQLRAESRQKTVIILVIALITVLVLVGAGLIIRRRKLREVENEERVEALKKMVEELKTTPAADRGDASVLRRAMLQQLGIIKMVAEAPTEQNRRMLRKISSIESDTNGELVNWANLFELINNLYGGFYDKMHSKFGDRLTAKEEQIIVLLMAGFSTKEIGVITTQTTATIYVRKSSIRKKIGVPEKEDIVEFLRDTLSC